MTTKVLERRLDKLERDLGASDGPRFLAVMVQPDESTAQALVRTLEEGGLSRDQVGRILYFNLGSKQFEQADTQPGLDSTLPGQAEFWSEFYETIKGNGKQRLSDTILAEAAAA